MENHYYINLAQEVLNRWPQAYGALAGGSLLRGQGKPNSDIDMIVLFPNLERGEKWWLRHKGVPFDVFCHDEETLRCFVKEGYDERRPLLLNIMAEAVVLGAAPQLHKWQRYARQALKKPLAVPDKPAWLRWRYALMDRLEDYEDVVCPIEQANIAAQLYGELNDVLCILGKEQQGMGKWRGRLALKADPDQARKLRDCFAADLADPQGKQLLAIGHELLAAMGGRLEVPEVMHAPPDKRCARLRLFGGS